MKFGKLSTAQLFSTKTGNIGLLLVGLYFCLVSLVMTQLQVIDEANVILGLTFICVAIMNARASPLVISGMLTGFLGVVNLLVIANVFPIDTAWMLTLICAIGVVALELTSLKFGKASKKAKIAVIIPMMSLFFMFLLAIIGYNPALYVNWATQPMKYINYVFLMFLTGLLSFQLLGWNVMKKNQGKWITILALICVATSFVGVYQGTLAW
jgi:hypothetical protein